MSIYSAFFAAYNASVQAGNPLSREEQIRTFTQGRTESLKDLNAQELQQLTALLQSAAPPQPSPKGRERSPEEIKADKMRKAIISIFYQMGRDVAAAKAWAEKQGVKGVKKKFNAYTTQELYALILVAEKALTDHQAAIRKALTPNP